MTTVQERLAQKTRGTPHQRWLSEHPEAKEFIETWIEMRISGDTDWSLGTLGLALANDYSWPFSADGHKIREWLYRAYGDRARQAIRAIR